jgi:RNA polymerase sigma factor FliA
VASASLDRSELVCRYLHLVTSVAQRLATNLPSNVETSDLINDGVFGLMDAVEKYDDARSVKFETYAVARITGAMLDALRSLDWVPRTVRQRAREVRRAFEGLEFELGRDPTDAELARRLQLSLRELDLVRQRVRATNLVSLELCLGERLEDAESDVARGIEREEFRRELVRAVETLPPHERAVIRRYYFKAETFRQIKDELGLSESRVSQIHARAVRHLREHLQRAE